LFFFSTLVSSPGLAYPSTQHSHSLAHQKSLSFGNNLYQQASNFGSQSQLRFPSGINHANINGMSAPTLQSPSPTFTPAQVANPAFLHSFIRISILVKYSILSIYAICKYEK
jgi:hypothetical protein